MVAASCCVQDILYSRTVDEAARLFRKHENQFTFWAYMACLDTVSRLDDGLTMNAKVVVGPVAKYIELHMATFLKVMAPREIANMLYCFARYDRFTRLRFSVIISKALHRSIGPTRDRFGYVWEGSFKDASGVQRGLPREMFSALSAAQPVPNQDIACAAWVRGLCVYVCARA